jgi:hypothetical protein
MPCLRFLTEDAALALAQGSLGANNRSCLQVGKQQQLCTCQPQSPKVSPECPRNRTQHRSMAFADTPDSVINSIALNRLDNLDVDEYIIALGPDSRQFLGTPNGYSA